MTMIRCLPFLLILAALILPACSRSGGGSDNSGLPTVADQVHFGATECVDFTGCGEPIWLNRRLGEMTRDRRCALKLCFAPATGGPDCMYNCPPELVVGCNGD